MELGPFCLNESVVTILKKTCFISGQEDKSGNNGKVGALYPEQAASFIQERAWPPLEYSHGETEYKGDPHLENGL